ncbi:Zinc transport protein ZntB [Propionicimonas sp. T2.31MG-18]|uniref:magnesium and cobalt transport protein CorA n=1 Tax=Propionicimonas sp. T2.31MG-18 TaxID=3157620 RepID=UPI0035E632DE
MKLTIPRRVQRAPLGTTLRNPPSPLSPSDPPSGSDPVDPLAAAIDWAHYVDGVRQVSVGFDEACGAARAGRGFVWLGLLEPDAAQLAALGHIFQLHPLALEDAGNERQRPKLEMLDDDTTFLSLRTLGYIDNDARSEGGEIVETGSATVFTGSWFAVTVRRGRYGQLQRVRRQLEASPRQMARGPIAVLHAVIDSVVDDYLRVAEAVEDDIEEIETHVFAVRGVPQVERIYELKRDLIEMKRSIAPLHGPLRQLADLQPDRELGKYFLDVHDHLEQVQEQVANFDELMSSILQAAVARLSIAENEDMRKISAWVAIAAVPTMIAGIYGMNFEFMPELHSPFGYPVVLGLLALACTLMYRSFRRQRWL